MLMDNTKYTKSRCALHQLHTAFGLGSLLIYGLLVDRHCTRHTANTVPKLEGTAKTCVFAVPSPNSGQPMISSAVNSDQQLVLPRFADRLLDHMRPRSHTPTKHDEDCRLRQPFFAQPRGLFCSQCVVKLRSRSAHTQPGDLHTVIHAMPDHLFQPFNGKRAVLEPICG